MKMSITSIALGALVAATIIASASAQTFSPDRYIDWPDATTQRLIYLGTDPASTGQELAVSTVPAAGTGTVLHPVLAGFVCDTATVLDNGDLLTAIVNTEGFGFYLCAEVTTPADALNKAIDFTIQYDDDGDVATAAEAAVTVTINYYNRLCDPVIPELSGATVLDAVPSPVVDVTLGTAAGEVDKLVFDVTMPYLRDNALVINDFFSEGGVGNAYPNRFADNDCASVQNSAVTAADFYAYPVVEADAGFTTFPAYTSGTGIGSSVGGTVTGWSVTSQTSSGACDDVNWRHALAIGELDVDGAATHPLASCRGSNADDAGATETIGALARSASEFTGTLYTHVFIPRPESETLTAASDFFHTVYSTDFSVTLNAEVTDISSLDTEYDAEVRVISTSYAEEEWGTGPETRGQLCITFETITAGVTLVADLAEDCGAGLDETCSPRDRADIVVGEDIFSVGDVDLHDVVTDDLLNEFDGADVVDDLNGAGSIAFGEFTTLQQFTFCWYSQNIVEPAVPGFDEFYNGEYEFIFSPTGAQGPLRTTINIDVRAEEVTIDDLGDISFAGNLQFFPTYVDAVGRDSVGSSTFTTGQDIFIRHQINPANDEHTFALHLQEMFICSSPLVGWAPSIDESGSITSSTTGGGCSIDIPGVTEQVLGQRHHLFTNGYLTALDNTPLVPADFPVGSSPAESFGIIDAAESTTLFSTDVYSYDDGLWQAGYYAPHTVEEDFATLVAQGSVLLVDGSTIEPLETFEAGSLGGLLSPRENANIVRIRAQALGQNGDQPLFWVHAISGISSATDTTRRSPAAAKRVMHSLFKRDDSGNAGLSSIRIASDDDSSSSSSSGSGSGSAATAAAGLSAGIIAAGAAFFTIKKKRDESEARKTGTLHLHEMSRV